MSKNIVKVVFVFIAMFVVSVGYSFDQHEGHDHSHDHATEHNHDHATTSDHGTEEGHGEHGEGGHEYDPTSTAIHHISDGNVWTILEAVSIPLPTILYAKDRGWDVFMSSKFHAGHHEDGHSSYNGYVLHHGSVKRVIDPSFPQKGSVDVGHFIHKTELRANGKEGDVYYVEYNGKEYKLDSKTTLDGGILGGGITSFWDFSITKNVVAMLIVVLLLFFMFRSAARKYKENPMKAPSGLQGMLETLVVFVRDEVAVPFIGEKKYMKYFPFLLSIFFFILGLNLFGQIPFLGSVNATGNLSITMVLAILVFLLVNLSGNKHYWEHTFWMPGVPVAVKPILAAVEGMGLFIKPLTLMLRLAGNISAGHIAILSFIGLIFIFSNSGESFGGGVIGSAMSIPLTLFMMAIELVVAFVQAFVFTILTASYIGAATEEAHH